MSLQGQFHLGGGGGSGKVRMNNIVVEKKLDAASPILMKYCASGQHFAKGRIICRKAGSEALEYMIITLKKIMVTEIETEADVDFEIINETVTFNFAEVQVEYTPQTDDGSGGACRGFGWNIEQNCEL